MHAVLKIGYPASNAKVLCYIISCVKVAPLSHTQCGKHYASEQMYRFHFNIYAAM